MRGSDGYATFTVFALILAFSGLLILLSSLIYQNTRNLDALRHAAVDDREFMDLAAEICRLLAEDPSPEADSPDDEVWQVNERGYSERFEVELTELSSRLNPNFDDLQFWKLTNLKSRVKSSFALSEWETDRPGRFAYDREEFKDLLFEEDWETLYTLHSLINPNGAPPEVLEGYLRQTGAGENTLSSFLSKSKGKRDKGERITQKEIASWLAGSPVEDEMILNSQSKINVNFADPLVIEAL